VSRVFPFVSEIICVEPDKKQPKFFNNKSLEKATIPLKILAAWYIIKKSFHIKFTKLKTTGNTKQCEKNVCDKGHHQN